MCSTSVRIRSFLAVFTVILATTASVAQQVAMLPVQGRITDGESKLEGCRVVLLKGNVPVDTITTNKNGKFEHLLEIGQDHALVFLKEGFVPKRVVIDTRFPEDPTDIVFEPLVMDISLLAEDKYTGVDTDVLDFPFAIIRYDRKMGGFAQDQAYSMGMQRANGALLLMAARAGKRQD